MQLKKIPVRKKMNIWALKLVNTSESITKTMRINSSDTCFRCQGASHTDNFKESFLGLENSKCKAPEAEGNYRNRKKTNMDVIE